MGDLLNVGSYRTHRKDIVVWIGPQTGDHLRGASCDHLEVQVVQLAPQMTRCLLLKLGESNVDQASFASFTTDCHEAEFDLLEVAHHSSDFIVYTTLLCNHLFRLLFKLLYRLLCIQYLLLARTILLIRVDIKSHVALYFSSMQLRVLLNLLYGLFVVLKGFLRDLIEQALLRRRRVTSLLLHWHVGLLPCLKVLYGLSLLILTDDDGLVHRVV